MRKEKVKNWVIVLLVLMVGVLSITNYQTYKKNKNYETTIQNYEATMYIYESTIEDDVYTESFLAGNYVNVVNSYYTNGLVSEKDYELIQNMVEDFLEDPTYYKANNIFEKSKSVILDGASALLK